MGISLAPSLQDVEGYSRIVSAEELGAVADADVLLVGSFVGSQTDALVALPTFTALPQVHRRPGRPTQPLGHPRGIPP